MMDFDENPNNSKGGVKKKCLTRCWKVPPSQFQAKIYLPTSKTGSYWLYLDSNKASSIHFQIFFYQTAPTDYIWIQIKPVQYIFKYFPKKIWAKKFPIQELGPKSTYLPTSIVSEIFFLPPPWGSSESLGDNVTRSFSDITVSILG